MAKRSKALPAELALSPSIVAEISAELVESHNDPEFWREQSRMARLDGRVTLANEADLAAKRAERRTGKAPAAEAENPIDKSAERQIVQAAAEREARKPRTPQVAPLNGMAALGVAPAAVETPIVAEPAEEEVQSPSREEPVAESVSPIHIVAPVEVPIETPAPRKGKATPQVAPLNGMTSLGISNPAKAGADAAKADDAAREAERTAKLVETFAVEPAIALSIVRTNDKKAGRGARGRADREARRDAAKPVTFAVEPAAEEIPPELTWHDDRVTLPAPIVPSPVLANGLTAEEEGTYQALAARRKPEPKSLTVKPGSITDRILAMLKDAGGHSVQEISDAMGWNKPSGQIIKIIRAAPFPVTTTKGADGRNRYTAG